MAELSTEALESSRLHRQPHELANGDADADPVASAARSIPASPQRAEAVGGGGGGVDALGGGLDGEDEAADPVSAALLSSSPPRAERLPTGGSRTPPSSGGAADGDAAPPPPSPKPWHHAATAMHDNESAEMSAVCSMLQEAVAMRQRYQKPVAAARRPPDGPPSPDPHYEPFGFPPEGPPPRSHHVFEFRKGVMAVWAAEDELPSLMQEYEAAYRCPHDFKAFTLDVGRLHDICASGPVYTFCVRRLALLESRYKLHTMEKEVAELAQMRANPHRDYYNCRKVDTHIHLAAAMNQKHLLRFIKKKMKAEPDTPVIAKHGHTLTLREVCDELRLSPYDINLDSLGMHADASTFRRFDKFNLKYNPLGDASLREIFLKTDNFIEGRYLAELTQELFADLEESKYVHTEYRLSVYGRSRDEWAKLARWVVSNRLYSRNNRWFVQVPRLFHLYAAKGDVASFEAFLDNLFAPLFEATRDPAAHPELHLFLQQLVAFDCVDDESKPDAPMPTTEADWARAQYPTEPREWTSATNPHYAYYIYYLYANLAVLNQFRAARGFSTFDFRPHAGEAGEPSHLQSTFLCAHGINHGLMLRRSPPLQYLFYLTQIGIAMSPLSNNMLFCELARSPFPTYFVRGLNVCLSTDDPLMFHYTKEPLMEEFCIARHTWQLSPVDLAELFRASVLQSSFERSVKAYWLGDGFWRPGAAGNDITRTNVPDIRLAFRDQAHREELQVVFEAAAATPLHSSYSAASAHPKPANWGMVRKATANGELFSVELLASAHEEQKRVVTGGAAARRQSVPSRVVPKHATQQLPQPLLAAAAAVQARVAQAQREQQGVPATLSEPLLPTLPRPAEAASAAAKARKAAAAAKAPPAEPGADEPRVLGVRLSTAASAAVAAIAIGTSAFVLGATVARALAPPGAGARRRQPRAAP